MRTTFTHLHRSPAPVRRFLPELINLIWQRRVDPGKAFDLTLPFNTPANGYAAMDERRALKTCANPEHIPGRPPSGRASALFHSPA